MFLSIVVLFVLFFISLTVHEFGHAWMAYKKGDPTAKYSGRLTLNPLAHIDPLGTVLLPLMLILSGSQIVFGWAKPVPINYWMLRNPKKDMIWIGLAGPGANIAFAVILGLVLRVLPFPLLGNLILLNIVLAIFNLVPIPPLDGSKVLLGLLPPPYDYKYMRIEPWGPFILVIFLIIPGFRTLLLHLAFSLYKIIV